MIKIKNILKVALFFSLTFCSLAWSKEQPKMPLKNGVQFLQKFKNFESFFLFADTLAPGKNYDKLAGWVKKNDALKNIQLKEITVNGLKVTFPGVKEPFQFLNDGRTIIYKNVGVKFDPTLDPEANMKKAEKAWGGFAEFKNTKTSALFRLLAPKNAFADGKGEAKEGIGYGLKALIGAPFLLLAMDVITTTAIATTAGTIAGLSITAISAAGGLYALYSAAKWVYFQLDSKGNMIKDAQLDCSSGSAKLKNGSDNVDIPGDGLTDEEFTSQAKSLAEICKSPEAVKNFNKAFAIIKKKIFTEGAKFFTKEADLKSIIQTDAMGNVIQGVQ